MPYGKDEKVIMFATNDKDHADLKIRLYYNGLGQGDFFRLVIASVLENDENMLELIEKFKEQKNVSKAKRAIVTKARTRAKNIKSQFKLDEDDIENIFDILEKEYPEL